MTPNSLSLEEAQNCSTIINTLLLRSTRQPNQNAFTFLLNGETEARSLTYLQLYQGARQVAAKLQEQGLTGERALLLYPAGLDFLTAFFGCLYAGVIAVPIYPPRRNQKLSRLLAIVNDAQPAIALTTSPILNDIESKWNNNQELTNLQLLATDTIESDGADSDLTIQSVTPDNLAFLQYTSGSTGMPKGVMVTHQNIIHNQQLIKTAFDHSDQSVGVGWLPLFHDMGLIGHVLQPIYVGIPSILMSPLAFLQKPIRWLQAISKYRATTSGGPIFAYDLCLQKVKPEQLPDLDLSSWDLAYSGAEPIRAETLERFAQKFAQCGFKQKAFYPCYGLAETTLFTTGGDKYQQPVIQEIKTEALERNYAVASNISTTESRAFVGCGCPYLDTTVDIVHPESLTRCERGQIGEIWVSGGSIAAGYWNRPDATEASFQAYLKDTGEGPFLRTGDLGFLLDGELYVTGRIKDVIIIRGQNHYPQDLEMTVQKSHPALRPNCGAAFTVEFKGAERLIVVQEVERSYLRKLNVNEVVGNVRQAIAAEHNLQLFASVLVKTGSIPKTSSGKIRRHACRAEFLTGNLNVVGDWSQNPLAKANFRHLQADVESLLDKVQASKQ
ncbi:MAG: fatty acyl-AMP ligase [Cyanobacteria bacterium J06621_8]